MNRLPNELLDRICCFLDRNELWKVVRLSSRLRSVAMLPYLSRFGISQANLQSGTLALSDSFFIILVVARIRPIQKLVCFEELVPGSQMRYRKLASILAVTAPIPDILIYNRHYMFQRTRREAAHLLSSIPSSATNLLVIVKGSVMSLSHPRSSPPIRWRLLPPPLGSLGLSTAMKILIVMFGIPLLFAYLVSAIINFGVVLIWLYRRITRPPWPQDERIIEDAGVLVFDDWMRIQTLPGKLTLVTLTDQRWPILVITRIPGLGDGVYSSILASIDLGVHLERLTVEPQTNLVHSELMALIHRHPHLLSISIGMDSIRTSSLTTMPMPPAPESKVYLLIAPSPYIPYLLPAAPNAQRISILPALAPMRGILRSAAFDLSAYRRALDSLAALPGTHPLTVNLTFPLAIAHLPWCCAALPDAEALDGALLPETRATRVHALGLYADNFGPRYRAADVHALLPWLALFPDLQRLTFAYGVVEKIPAPERAVLAEAICVACARINTPQDIAFNIADD
ncbi:hypothetical protein DFH06DRAFT_1440042 [Mycena polygramma]|nr:hypothetical protein DFH06DRAFT_1440042 [Mycena polygramma]